MTIALATSLPAGSLAPIAHLKSGEHILNIVQRDIDGGGSYYVYIKFPDDFRKTFQVKKITELTASISNVLRYRYGVESFKFTKITEDMSKDSNITITIL